MRVDRQTQKAHGAALLKAAGRLFRRDGLAAVGVAEIAREAGLTHGAFYGHFASKADCAAAACRAALEDGATRWRARAARARAEGRDPVGALIDAYLSERHRDAPEIGCVLATLGPEVARAAPPLGDALAAGTDALVVVLAAEIAERRPMPDPVAAALGALAAMTGGIVLARALAAHPDRSRAALEAARRAARAAADLSFPALPGITHAG